MKLLAAFALLAAASIAQTRAPHRSKGHRIVCTAWSASMPVSQELKINAEGYGLLFATDRQYNRVALWPTLRAKHLHARAAKLSPRHSFQPGFGNRLIAGYAYAVRSLVHPCERRINRFKELSVGLLHTDLKLRLSVGIGLIDEVAFPAPCSRHECSDHR